MAWHNHTWRMTAFSFMLLVLLVRFGRFGLGHGDTLAPASLTNPMPSLEKPDPGLTIPLPTQDCATVLCEAPKTLTPLGSPCGCVLPIQIELELSVALYGLFPSVSVLAEEIAYGTLLLLSQVRVTGASADPQDQSKSIAEIDLVPLGEAFDNLTAFLIFQKIWNHEVAISKTIFGNYAVIHVHYPGLPPSPPFATPSGTSISGLPGTEGGPSERPLGVDINKKSEKISSGTFTLIVLSAVIAAAFFLGVFWVLILKCSELITPAPTTAPFMTMSVLKRSGGASKFSSELGSSSSTLFASSIAICASSAKTFPLSELERATDNFNEHNIIGEGGFGRVFCGTLNDGTEVAVKILTRDYKRRGNEFITEVEMLSHLHHRNVVKLIGICTEEHNRCLVYELIPNGSVELHLHGTDKLISPLDWDTRMKIALGAARGLAYLHEDANPRVIHRDFKASNILLENDFNPKIADFGLAKAAPDDVSGHISTRVMGTFGYLAPEYAMTGNLLVKSDVYSYGVVLLELLSGRKPVDMSQAPGQENLVTWARPLLSSRGGLEMLVDPTLEDKFPFENLARVAAIAAMCVQPEFSNRPFMGEVVQALKIICSDSDASNEICSVTVSPPSQDSNGRSDHAWAGSGVVYAADNPSFISVDYDSGTIAATDIESGRPLSASSLFSDSGELVRKISDSFRRHSTSGPIFPVETNSGWGRERDALSGSMSVHGFTRHFGDGLGRDFFNIWP